jgi:hypothetical protein
MSDAQPEAIIEQIEELLTLSDISHVRGKDRASLRAIFWPNGRPVEFRVRVFKDRWESGHPYVVEFQRRGGDAFAFRKAYQVLTNFLPPPFNVGPIPSAALAPFGGIPIPAKDPNIDSHSGSDANSQSLAQLVRPDAFPLDSVGVYKTLLELSKGPSHREQGLLMLLHWAEHQPCYLATLLEVLPGRIPLQLPESKDDPTIRRARFRLFRILLEAAPRFVNRLDGDVLFGQCAEEMSRRDPKDDSLALVDLDEQARGLIKAIITAGEE